MHNGLWGRGGTHFNKRIKQMMGSTVRPLWTIEDLLVVDLSLQSNVARCEKTPLIDGITVCWWWGCLCLNHKLFLPL